MKSDNNEVRNRIKQLLAAEGVTLTDLVDAINERHQDEPTTRQNITNKLARQTIRYNEVIEIADALNYEVIFKNRTTGKEI